ncbi:hypothetical protein BOX15_Mlig023637g1 [Macrostomum lignano]|uniref:Uncharacterized protein n=1 Tax=Macrostomum lignano TaxID=282301 RepID=A0A267GSW7_9PLAT|nr:hypothetical protein BOX15_Mlig023637g1 [Macrostomum lignano]
MICDTRKGTSTRKPRLNPQVVEMQEMIQSAILRGGGSAGAGAPGGAGDHGGDAESDQSGSQSLPRLSSGGAKHPTSGGGGGAFRKGSGAVSLGGARNHHHHQKLPRLRNVDRSTARHIPVTANGVTVIITDFKPKTSVASAVAKSKRSVAMESSSNAAATGDHADDSSTSIASPPMPNSLLTSTNLPPPSLTTKMYIRRLAHPPQRSRLACWMRRQIPLTDGRNRRHRYRRKNLIDEFVCDYIFIREYLSLLPVLSFNNKFRHFRFCSLMGSLTSGSVL